LIIRCLNITHTSTTPYIFHHHFTTHNPTPKHQNEKKSIKDIHQLLIFLLISPFNFIILFSSLRFSFTTNLHSTPFPPTKGLK
jgi:hypothetical protein